MTRLLPILCCLLSAFAAFGDDTTLLRAFPGAEGFGAVTAGGRGGRVLYVTTLDDYVPGETPIAGSLRAAIDADGPRIILFKVGGTIALKADLWAHKPFFTLAGQTAPGGGICLRDYQFVLGTNDAIIRHIRFRSGDTTRKEQMSVGIFGGNNSILDHCSMSWDIDETMSSFGTVHNLTVQWSVIAEALSKSFHPKGEHSKGSILNGDGGMTMHHCIYAHCASRNPRADKLLLDFRNNVLYDWGFKAGYTREAPIFMNYVNCYAKPGPSTRKSARGRLFEPGDDMARLYLSGNVVEGDAKATADNRVFVKAPESAEVENFLDTVIVPDSFPCPQVATDTAEKAFERVIADCGATLPKRDSADTRLMDEVRAGTGRIIDSPSDVGGWPDLDKGVPVEDTDGDGMPDVWEKDHGFDPNSAADGNTDADGGGYTNVEEYLNGTDPRKAEANCRVDAAAMRAVQEQAMATVAKGKEEFEQRSAGALAARKVRAEELKKSLKISFEPQPGPDVKKLTVLLDGKPLMEMALIPAGSFLMGSPESEGGLDRERPQHRVNISKPFYMAATLTTTAQLCAIYGPGARTMTEENKDLPAKETAWFEATECCEILSAATGRAFRLPTEAEWEYACRAGTATAFNTGATITTDQANFNGLESTPFNPVGVFRGKTTPARSFPPNPWGLYDMHGNEAEYCQDHCFRKYTLEEVTDPVGPDTGGAYVLRGGKSTSKAFYLRSAFRYGYTPYVGYGFRAVMEMPR
jgi:formylglycine-generating enzyme required for sulfatase activity